MAEFDINGRVRHYWEGIEAEEIRYQRCGACQESVFPPHSLCPHCSSDELEWATSGGKGRVYTYSTIERGALPEFKSEVPYTVVIVTLDEGFRMVSQIVDASPASIACEAPVSVDFRRRGDGKLLPYFRLEQS